MIRLVLAGWLLMSVEGVAQRPAVADPFERLAFLIGKWEGISDGQPGKGTVRREYARAVNSRFLRASNRSEYGAQPKNPKGEIHEDEGFFSFDKTRKRLVFRQFHTEGFVIAYIEDAESSSTKVVFTSEAIENIPGGFRARETYLVQGADGFEEVFELAEPNKPFEVYFANPVHSREGAVDRQGLTCRDDPRVPPQHRCGACDRCTSSCRTHSPQGLPRPSPHFSPHLMTRARTIPRFARIESLRAPSRRHDRRSRVE